MTSVIDMKEKDKKEIADSLAEFFASTYSLYLKTQNFHWNVKGMMFKPLHELFEEQYTDMNGAIDELAERITTLGFKAPGTFAELQELSILGGEKGVPEDYNMVKQLISDHKDLVRNGQELISLSEEKGDTQTADMVTGRLQSHEKMIWMLESSLNPDS